MSDLRDIIEENNNYTRHKTFYIMPTNKSRLNLKKKTNKK